MWGPHSSLWFFRHFTVLYVVVVYAAVVCGVLPLFASSLRWLLLPSSFSVDGAVAIASDLFAVVFCFGYVVLLAVCVLSIVPAPNLLHPLDARRAPINSPLTPLT